MRSLFPPTPAAALFSRYATRPLLDDRRAPGCAPSDSPSDPNQEIQDLPYPSMVAVKTSGRALQTRCKWIPQHRRCCEGVPKVQRLGIEMALFSPGALRWLQAARLMYADPRPLLFEASLSDTKKLAAMRRTATACTVTPGTTPGRSRANVEAGRSRVKCNSLSGLIELDLSRAR